MPPAGRSHRALAIGEFAVGPVIGAKGVADGLEVAGDAVYDDRVRLFLDDGQHESWNDVQRSLAA